MYVGEMLRHSVYFHQEFRGMVLVPTLLCLCHLGEDENTKPKVMKCIRLFANSRVGRGFFFPPSCTNKRHSLQLVFWESVVILRAVEMWDRSATHAFDEITAFVVAGVQCKVLNAELISHTALLSHSSLCCSAHAALIELLCFWCDYLRQSVL